MAREDTSLLTVMVEAGMLSPIDAKMIRYTVEGEAPANHAELYLEATLINRAAMEEHSILAARELQAGLRSPDLVIRTQTRTKIAKMRASQLRKQIADNQRLADSVIRTGSKLEKKSSSSEYLAVGLIAAKESR